MAKVSNNVDPSSVESSYHLGPYSPWKHASHTPRRGPGEELWLVWEDDSQVVKAGITLGFRVRSQVTAHGRTYVFFDEYASRITLHYAHFAHYGIQTVRRCVTVLLLVSTLQVLLGAMYYLAQAGL